MSDTTTMPDLSIERDLLAHHDFSAMHDRLDRSIRRAFAIRVATVAALIALVASLMFAAFHPSPSSSNAPNCPCDVAPAHAIVSATPTPIVAPAPLPIVVTPPAPPPKPHVAAIAHVAPKPIVERTPIVEPTTPAIEAPAPTSPVVQERSRLRAELSLYNQALDAAANGKHDDAVRIVHELCGEYADTPIAIEAQLLEARVLLDDGDVDNARAKLSALEDPATKAGKHALWTKLHARLPKPPALDDE